MSTPIVEVKHLSHRYSVDWAIRDINFSIEKTGILGLLGSNGAGKSTTMNHLWSFKSNGRRCIYQWHRSTKKSG